MKNRTPLDFRFQFLLTSMVFLSGAAYGQLLFQNGNSFGAYNFDGTTINPAYIVAGLSNPQGIAIYGTNIYVANNPGPSTNGTIGLYNLDGTLVNASLISGVQPAGIAISGTNLYVANTGNAGFVGVYNLDGTAVNTTLIKNVGGANGIAIDGTNIFLAYGFHSVGKYNLDGTTVNAQLIYLPLIPAGLVISGTNLYVANFNQGKIGKYGLDGTVVNASLISGLSLPNGLAINGNILYVQCAGSKTVGKYGLDGTVLNSAFVSGLTNPPFDNYGILILPPPILHSSGLQTNGYGFNVSGISNQTVLVEACSDLSSSFWTPIQTNVLGANPNNFSDPVWTNYSSRFYRVRAR